MGHGARLRGSRPGFGASSAVLVAAACSWASAGPAVAQPVAVPAPTSVPSAPAPGLPPLPTLRTPAASPPGADTGAVDGFDEGSGPRLGNGREVIPFLGPPPGHRVAPPGLPPRNGRPRPGSIFDPGATGPGISQRGDENFLDGALDPRTGWPFVFLDHFQPQPERVARFWVVQTRECPQVMGTDPWPRLKVLHFDGHGNMVERDPRELLAQCSGRVVLVQVQGSLTTPDIALGGLLWTDSWLRRNRSLPDDAVVVAFDWPSQRVYRFDPRDINEKGRRAYVAGYHLARFLQAFPPESRICLIGQSYGGRVVPSALHLLGGGALNSQARDPEVRLPSVRPDLHLRAVVIAGASDHNWLDPGRRLDRALHGCEGLLNLYNRRDEALRLYPLLTRSGHRHALGKVGLSNRDLAQLGPLAARYAEHDVHDILGREHTLLDAVANPQIARRIAPYLWVANPGLAPAQSNVEPEGLEDRKSNARRRY